MGYEEFLATVEGWKLQLKHNDEETRVSITNEKGVVQYMTITRAQAQQLKRHLFQTLPYEHGLDPT